MATKWSAGQIRLIKLELLTVLPIIAAVYISAVPGPQKLSGCSSHCSRVKLDDAMGRVQNGILYRCTDLSCFISHPVLSSSITSAAHQSSLITHGPSGHYINPSSLQDCGASRELTVPADNTSWVEIPLNSHVVFNHEQTFTIQVTYRVAEVFLPPPPAPPQPILTPVVLTPATPLVSLSADLLSAEESDVAFEIGEEVIRCCLLRRSKEFKSSWPPANWL